jgi:transposase
MRSKMTFRKQDPDYKALKQAVLDLLKLAAQEGHIDLKYLDESGCCLESPVSYTYARIGQQKRIEQVKSYGDRLSILGVWQEEQSFEYSVVQGSFTKERYVKVINQVAEKSEQNLKETGRITVIVQDNSSSHTSHLAREHWSQWQSQGLYLFFLPPSSSEMNLIETQWHQLKNHEIAGRIFDNEYDLANAIIEGMENRSQQGGWTLERLTFKSV